MLKLGGSSSFASRTRMPIPRVAATAGRRDDRAARRAERDDAARVNIITGDDLWGWRGLLREQLD